LEEEFLVSEVLKSALNLTDVPLYYMQSSEEAEGRFEEVVGRKR